MGTMRTDVAGEADNADTVIKREHVDTLLDNIVGGVSKGL